MSIKVGVVGYGTIGKRVADAVMLQNDMELVGITAHCFNYRINSAHKKGVKIFELDDVDLNGKGRHSEHDLEDHGIKPEGKFQDLLNASDVIVDATPSKIGMKNRDDFYKKNNVKAIFQGGEKHEVGEVSFVAQCNYNQAVGKQFIRVVSCNTTGLCRTLSSVHKKYGIDNVHATMIRRAADPWDIYHGPINAVVPVLELPSHHGPDARTIMPELEIYTTALSVPTTIMHVHSITADLKQEVNKDDVVKLFKDTTRVRVVKNSERVRSTAEIMELARDLGRHRGDMPEICVWDGGVGVYKKKLFYLQAIHQESNVVPENIDAIRAASGFEDGEKSISMTNESLGID
tara:strand:+ start:2735 stop:3772 length:1038 start_codon:yes stop_codon:yes gene_type:complete